MPQFVSFLECLFQTITARLGDKASAKVLCYWSIQFCSLLAAMSEGVGVEACMEKRWANPVEGDSNRTEPNSSHERLTDNADNALWAASCDRCTALDAVYPFDG
jgi:hypothetical protein